ncbi:hypothetical protein [Microcoleus sp. FACHB-68]|uniref:hypothetical protein n=1 Tax=Microcoleus sp. FACHB-68 TaxID=2692826 RepID=UPI0016894AA9|nr:hypothetical protein [Microcoleus sp. FACHB-68]MBD1937854.1 hypothetical protein [Microcoleus sp. FACHB-68]
MLSKACNSCYPAAMQEVVTAKEWIYLPAAPAFKLHIMKLAGLQGNEMPQRG